MVERAEEVDTSEFERLYMSRWEPMEQRCEVQSRDERCANAASYRLEWGTHGTIKTGVVCRSCLSEWVAQLTERYGNGVVVTRVLPR